MDSDEVFIVGGRSFMYIMKSKGPEIDPWGNPCSTVYHFEGNFCNYFISVFVFCQDLNQLATVP
jgi:hypothetical protein